MSADLKWNLIVDVAKCANCNTCYMTLLDEYVDNSFPGYSAPCPRHGHRWIRLQTRERGAGSLMDVAYLFTTCNQCDEAPCRKAAPDCVHKREDGIVILDPDKSRGRKDLLEACPYGHIWWNDAEGLPQKWIWDAHLLDQGWKEPRPVSVCAAGSLRTLKVRDEAMREMAERNQWEVLHPEWGTRPRIWYANLHRFYREHIAGSVARVANGLEDALEGAQVILLKDGAEIARTVTDFFGDFKFDGLKPDSGNYVILAEQGGVRREVSAALGKSVNIGIITL